MPLRGLAARCRQHNAHFQHASLVLVFSLGAVACSDNDQMVDRERFVQLASDAILSHYEELEQTDIQLSDNRFVIFCNDNDPCMAFLKFQLVRESEAYDRYSGKEITVSVTDAGIAKLELSRYGGLVAGYSST